jgi:hypothetical protein
MNQINQIDQTDETDRGRFGFSDEWGGRVGARKVGKLAAEDANVRRDYW